MRHDRSRLLLPLALLWLTAAPAFSQYDSFTLPPGVEDTRIPTRLRSTPFSTPGANQSDLIEIERLRLQIEILYKKYDYASAEPLYRAYVALIERVAPDDARLASALQNYADLLQKLHKNSEAAAMIGKAQMVLSRLQSDARPFGFKQYKLGMTLDEFTHLPSPGINTQVKSICSCDEGQALEVLTPEDKVARIVQCGFWLGEKSQAGKPYRMTVADIECRPDFKFIQGDEKSDDPLRLFEISLTFFRSYFDNMKEALIAHYGKPKELRTPYLRTEMGNNFQVQDLIWDNGISKIRLTNVDGTDLTRAKLRFIHKQLSLIYAKRISDEKSLPLKRAEEDL
jgi:hypothetical protein